MSLLLGELVAKVLLALAQVRLATLGVDERVRVASEQALVLLREIEEASVRTEENIARQSIQQCERSFKVVSDTRIAFLSDKSVIERALASYPDDVIDFVSISNFRGPRCCALGMARSKMRDHCLTAELDRLSVMHDAIGRNRWKG